MGSGGGRSPFFGDGEEAAIEQLHTADFEVRLRVLNRLRLQAQDNPAWFRNFRRKRDLVEAFGSVLEDGNWEVQHQCLKFLWETVESFGRAEVAWTPPHLMPGLVGRLASSKITVRRVAAQALAVYLPLLNSLADFHHQLLSHQLTSTNPQMEEVLRELPSVFVRELAGRDWAPLVARLATLVAASHSPTAKELCLHNLEKLHEVIGSGALNAALGRVSEADRRGYDAYLQQKGRRNFATPTMERSETRASDIVGKQFRFGIIPMAVHEVLLGDADVNVKCAALEQLKAILQNLKSEEVKRLQHHIFPYLNLLGNTLDELNVKVVVCALDVVRVSVGVLGRSLDQHLSQLVKLLGKHLGNQKSVLKQLNMMSVVELASALGPKPVLAALAPFLQHRNSRVREEVVNVTTGLLLKFPSNAVNLTAVAVAVAPALADPRRRVRVAAFELVSVLAQALGPGRHETLMKPVREVQAHLPQQGLVSALQARLARHQLPKGLGVEIRYDGLVEYSVPVGGPESLRGAGEGNDDFHWIMSAGVGPGSALSRQGFATAPPHAPLGALASPGPQHQPDLAQPPPQAHANGTHEASLYVCISPSSRMKSTLLVNL